VGITQPRQKIVPEFTNATITGAIRHRITAMDLHQVRRRLEGTEQRLSPYAARSTSSRGRARPESPSPVRTDFQRDRDRILHTKAFRRLKHKTQVFIAPSQDHYVTRLTHTLEVAQVARTIARALNLNEDLAEAAALGHDIGHGPFGHAGEEALAECLPEGFRHNYQSVRVLDRLENGGLGLNLTFEVLDAIEKSSKAREDIFAEGWGVPATLEGQVVKTADAIAYVNHDILDAIRAGLIGESDLPEVSRRELGHTHAERLNTIICDAVEASWAATGAGPEPVIQFSGRIRDAVNELREFMFQRVYLYDSTRLEAERGKRIVKFLFAHFVATPGGISPDFSLPEDPVERRAADFVSGMTDRYAIRLAGELGCHDAVGWRE
jgi:dGTPase